MANQSGSTFKNLAALIKLLASIVFVFPENQSFTEAVLIPTASAIAFFVRFGGPTRARSSLSASDFLR